MAQQIVEGHLPNSLFLDIKQSPSLFTAYLQYGKSDRRVDNLFMLHLSILRFIH
jgi:hypothetical protein